MKGLVRILHLEDNDTDSELLHYHLAKEIPGCEIFRVKSKDQFLQAIKEPNFQVILSDYSLPSFTGVDALKIAQVQAPDIPFLFCSGTIGEEHAIETLKLGATDYVLKDRIGRLAPAILRALEEANEKSLRLKAEEDLRKSQERYRLVVELSPDMIFVESGGRIVFMNPTGMRLVGAVLSSEVLGKPVSEIFIPEQRHALELTFLALMQGEKPPPQELKMIRLDGKVVDVELTIALLQTSGSRGVLGMARNITDRKYMEDELRHSQKMEAVGQLAGGLAHDFNNTLMAIYGYAELLLMKLPPEDENVKHVNSLLEAASKSASLTRQLLAFSRKQVVNLRPMDINRVVEGLADMMRLVLGDNIQLDLKLHTNLHQVQIDAGRLEQILMNLVVNARDAMPAGGVLRIATSPSIIETGPHAHGPFVRLTVQDTGTGMPEEVKARCFEPFFTTKEEGKGTGLGLANVYAIVRQLSGHISIDSSQDAGTTFKIDFPAVESSEILDTIKEGAVLEHKPNGMSGKIILLVDDNKLVLQALGSALQKSGGKLLTANSAMEALKIDQSENQIDLLITDIMMPQINGFQLAEQMRSKRNQLKVIFISGYAEENLIGALPPDSVFVSKPASVSGILNTASRLFQKNQSGTAGS